MLGEIQQTETYTDKPQSKLQWGFMADESKIAAVIILEDKACEVRTLTAESS